MHYSSLCPVSLLQPTSPASGPAFPTDALYRFADGTVDPVAASDGGLGFVCVREDHTKPNPSDVVNAVVKKHA